MRILVVDDDDETREVVGRALDRHMLHPVLARDSVEAGAALATTSFDVIVLDVMLAEESGLTLCRELRKAGVRTPILFLSARGSISARVEGLDVGGDDYLPKPFAVRELVARVKALGRRAAHLRPTVVTIGSLSLDLDARRAASEEREIPITRREWDVVSVLAAARGRVVSYDDLLERAWGDASESAQASLEVIVSRLRRKLDPAAGRPVLRTVRGHGYAMEPEA